MYLTRNFNIFELKTSREFPEIAKNMKLSNEIIKNSVFLLESCWQKVRNEFGIISVLSFYRDIELNTLISGSRKSDHLNGTAMDGTAVNADNEEVFKWIVNRNLPYRQVIYYPNKNFIHMSVNIPGVEYKNETLICDNKKYIKYKEY